MKAVAVIPRKPDSIHLREIPKPSAPHVGELDLADIGVPPSLYGGPAPGLNLGPIFAGSEILRIR